ncbi:ankyrin repeat-containing domain protein [Mycena vulgaris]|nr:ankyrin repeat-containing domain protein [Mycena vulgaris]
MEKVNASKGSYKRLSPRPPSRPHLRLPRPLFRLASPARLAYGRLVRPRRLGPAPAPRVRHHASFSLAHTRLVHARLVRADAPAHAPELKVQLPQPAGAYSCFPSTSMNYFDELPPELIGLLPPWLSTVSLNALVLTCRRMRDILQPELESRITPQLGRQLLLWAAAAKPHIVAKLLSPPHSIPPNARRSFKAPLHVAASAGQLEIVTMLLEAGADPAADWDQQEYQALHLAAKNKDLAMMRVLLDHGAPIDSTFGTDACSESALHLACTMGHIEMIALLLERGANIESEGHFGGALGFAVHWGRLDVVKLLLAKGARL